MPHTVSEKSVVGALNVALEATEETNESYVAWVRALQLAHGTAYSKYEVKHDSRGLDQRGSADYSRDYVTQMVNSSVVCGPHSPVGIRVLELSRRIYEAEMRMLQQDAALKRTSDEMDASPVDDAAAVSRRAKVKRTKK